MKLPAVSGIDAVRAFRKAAYEFRHADPVPNHKELAKVSLRSFSMAVWKLVLRVRSSAPTRRRAEARRQSRSFGPTNSEKVSHDFRILTPGANPKRLSSKLPPTVTLSE